MWCVERLGGTGCTGESGLHDGESRARRKGRKGWGRGVENVYYRAARARFRGRGDGGWRGDGADGPQFAVDLGASSLASSNVWRHESYIFAPSPNKNRGWFFRFLSVCALQQDMVLVLITYPWNHLHWRN